MLGRGLYIDVGIIKPESIRGYKYFIITIDDATRFKRITFVKEKKEVASALILEIAEIKVETGKYPD